MEQEFNRLCNTRYGRMLYNIHDIYIGRSLSIYGEYCRHEIELMQQYLRPGDTVVEAGANIGTHTLPLAQAVGESGQVWAYEPQRIVNQTLNANVALNHLTNVRTLWALAGAQAGSADVPVIDPRQPRNFGGVSMTDGEYDRSEQVPVIPVDDLPLPACRCIKADVEGAESEVLRGAEQTIAKYRPMLYVENDREQNSAALIAQISAMDYRLWWHPVPLFVGDNYNAAQHDVFGNIFSLNMLCLPAEEETGVDNFPEVQGPGDRFFSRGG